MSFFYFLIFFLINNQIFAFEFSDFIDNLSDYNELTIGSTQYIQIKDKDLPESKSGFKSQPERYNYDDWDYNSRKWNKFIDKLGSLEIEEEINVVERSSITVSTIPVSPGPQVEFLDSGTSLNVTGRKVISFNYSGKKYIKEQTNFTRDRSTSLFDITQQLQIRMQGKVGEKISVNVDYDDTKEDKEDISVTYQGDPQEVVQNISFGDIDLSLPSTEFVSYNKQLFGLRADLKSNRFRATLIGSRTKGQTKTRQFKGNTQFQTSDILDTSYIRRKYYDLTFGDKTRLPIKPGSEKIYIDQQTNEVVDGVIISSITADDLSIIGSTYTGRFKLMTRGVDYTVDYNKGIVIFARSLNSVDVLIVDYQDKNGNWLRDENLTGRYKILKSKDDVYMSNPSEKGWRNEIKTYYYLGQINIMRDDGHGNFILNVQNLNRQEIGSTLNPPQKYPDTIEVDFEQGIIHLSTPFASETGEMPDPLTYSQSPVAKRIIHVEYYYRLKTFYLEPNIVLNSEIITIDGVKLSKNQDYYIDYDAGFLTFYNPERITQNSIIDISYEVSPFGSSNQTLAGGRVSYDIFNNATIGATALYQGSTKVSKAPHITDIPSRLFVYDSDLQIKNLNIFGMKTSLSGEIAQSRLNPNINDYAIVDNMEGVKQEDSASMDKNYWYIASNPSLGPSHPDSLSWNTEEIDSKDINPNSPGDSKQQVLVIDYDFSISTEVSLVYVFSKTGLDFSQKNSFELTISGDNNSSGPLINLHFGEINEDSDNSGGMTLLCSNARVIYNAPKTEDTNCDGILSPSEDIGWLYSPQGYSSKRFGNSNGRIDTQDLDGNGRLDSGNPSVGGSFGYISNSYFIDITNNNTPTNIINFSNWHNLVYPIVIASSESYKWSSIKEVRISLKKTEGSPVRGRIKIARISAVGNTWNVSLSTSSSENLKILAVNNIDNTDYTPIYNAGGDVSSIYNDLYGSVSDQKSESGSSTISEQALLINYTSVSLNSQSYVYRKFPSPIDISQHKKFRFMLYNKQAESGVNFYIKVGDTGNYYKASVPLNFVGWRAYEISQNDLNDDGIADMWENSGRYQVDISSFGIVSFEQIPKIIAGVEVLDASTHSLTVYLNEIHLAQSAIRVGNARKVSGDFEISNFASFGAKHRFIDRGFQTPVSAITNQDNEQNTAYLNLLKPSFFPTSYTYSKQNTNTPNIYNTGANNLVNALQQGKVQREDITAQGLLNLPIIPKTNLSYFRNNVKYDLLKREDDKNTYSASTNYQPPFDFFIIPKNISGSYTYISNKITYSPPYISTSDYYNTDERTNSYSIKLNFLPIKNFTFNPSYSLSTVKEKRINLYNLSTSFEYPKSLQQNVEFNSSIKLLKWFAPYFSYSVSTLENNNISITTVTLAQETTVYNIGEIKSVNRNAQGAINLSINVNDLAPNLKSLRSMVITANYQLQDGDVWQNVEKDYDTKTRLWIRSEIRPKNPFAYRTSATLRDSYSSTLRWQPFEAFIFSNSRLKPLSTLSITNNYNYSEQKSYNNQIYTKSVNKTLPDLIISISQLENMFKVNKWATAASMNIRYSYNTNTIVETSMDKTNSFGIDLRFNFLRFMNTSIVFNYKATEKKDLKLDQITGYNQRKDFSIQGTFDIKNYRFTPKLDYSNDYAETTLKTVVTNTTLITPAVMIKTDVKIPKTVKLPFLSQTTFDNRIIWTTNISYSIKKSPISINDNNKLFSLTSTADIEATKNLRISFNASLQRYWHKYLPQEDYFAYQFGSNVILQF
ncbi:MAG: hypothetical protein K6357_00220 [Elusimicrobiota bacterium]